MWSTDLVLFENDAAAAYAFSAARSALQLIVRLVYVVYAIQPDGRHGGSVYALTLSGSAVIQGCERRRSLARNDRPGRARRVTLCMPRGVPTRPA